MVSVGVIGTGNMGSAMVKGWARASSEGLGVIVWDRVEAAARQFDGFPCVRVASGLEDLVHSSSFIFVVVKPKDAPQVFERLRLLVNGEQTVVSAMAGVTLAWLREALGPGPTLARIMPNLAVEFGAGTIGLVRENNADEQKISACRQILGCLGLVEIVPEDCLDAVTAIAGSGPALFALALEAAEDGAVAAGLSRVAARALVLRAASRLGETPEDLWEGLREISSWPEPLLASDKADWLLGQRGVREAFRQAVLAAVERARSMLLHLPRPGAVH